MALAGVLTHAGGKRAVQIARQLGRCECTATTHVSNILNRLAFASRTQLAAWVAEGGEYPRTPLLLSETRM
jgi:DNA-binding NarL/FixJ family response regulator